MICYNCGNKIYSLDADRCIFCGMKFKDVCPSCSWLLPAFVNFCPNCGEFVKKSGDVRQTVEELKKVAVMFADISGFTRLSEKTSPDRVNDLINEFFEFILKPVYYFEGSIDKFIGDCVMILFGTKTSHLDDPKRAVLCALEMLKLCNEFSEERNLKISIRIGINYGIVAVGKVGGYYEKDYTVIGDVVNVAQRLQSVAPENGIYVSESIYRETFDSILYSEAKEIYVKNKSEPIRCYMPLKVISETNFLEPFSNIQDQYLSKLFNLIASKKENGILLVGPGGTGKTTLLERLSSHLLSNSIRTYYIKCSPNIYSRPYLLISQIICRILNISPEDVPGIKYHRLVSFLDFLFKDDFEKKSNCLNFLSVILQLNPEEEFRYIFSSMTPEDIEREIIQSTFLFFDTFLSSSFSIFLIDDIQFADIESIKVIEYIKANLAPDKGIFVITSDNENIKLNFQETIYIQKLSPEKIEEILKAVFNVNSVDRDFTELVSDISDGKIAYIQEICKWLQISNKLSVRNNILYLINFENSNSLEIFDRITEHRISKFDKELIEFLKIAAVYGKRFSFRVISDILKPSKPENDIILILTKNNFIKLVDIVYQNTTADKIFEFTNNFVFEAILKSIPKKIKANIHYRIANSIEKLFKDAINNYFDLLIYHYMEAEDFLNATKYCILLAHNYKRQLLYRYSVKYFKLALEILTKCNQTKHRFFVEALEELSILEKQMGNYTDAISYLQILYEHADAEKQLFIKCHMCECFILTADFDNAREIIVQLEKQIGKNHPLYLTLIYLKSLYHSYTASLEIDEILKEIESLSPLESEIEILIKALNITSYSLFRYHGNIKKAVSFLQKARGLATRVNNIFLRSKTTANFGILYFQIGNTNKAIHNLLSAFEDSKKIYDKHTQIDILINLGIIHAKKGLLKKAYEYLNQAYENSKKWSLLYEECLCLLNIGEVYIEKGLFFNAYELFLASLNISEEKMFTAEKILGYIYLAKVLSLMKNFKACEDFLSKSELLIEEVKDTDIEYEYHLTKADFLLQINNLSQAEKEIELALELSNKITFKQIESLRKKSEIMFGAEKYNEAIDCLSDAIKLCEESGFLLELAKCYVILAKVYINISEKTRAKYFIELAEKTSKHFDDEVSINLEILKIKNLL